MSSLFPEIAAEVVGRLERRRPKRGDLFIVLACWRDGDWSIPSALRGPWNSRDRAEKEASKLDSGWSHVRIVRIPGEAGEGAG